MRILVVEDDAPLASYIRKGLEAEHYAVDVALDGEQGALMASDLDYDLLVLDLNLPKLDGISLLRNLRPSKPEVPVLVLTARPLVEDRVHALDSGADDCINKPFSYSELSARVRALMRRGRPSVESILQVADLQLNRIERKVRRNGRQIELTAKEFALLEYLMRNAGRRITRSMIIEHVWNISFDTTSSSTLTDSARSASSSTSITISCPTRISSLAMLNRCSAFTTISVSSIFPVPWRTSKRLR